MEETPSSSYSTHKSTTLEKGEQLMVLIQHDDSIVSTLKYGNDQERQAILDKVGLTVDEVNALMDDVNNKFGTETLAKW